MQANFYHTNRDERYANKEIGSAIYSNIDIEILEPASIEEPRLLVSSGLIGHNVNYLYISELERYYFIRSWTMKNGYVELETEEDYLCSHLSDLKKNNVIVKRNERLYNMYLNDDQYKTQARTAVRTVVFPSGFTGHQIILGTLGHYSSNN